MNPDEMSLMKVTYEDATIALKMIGKVEVFASLCVYRQSGFSAESSYSIYYCAGGPVQKM